MMPTRKQITAATALYLVFAVAQMGMTISFAGAEAPTEPQTQSHPMLSGILKTKGNRPISINGASATSGATVLTGSLIETPDQVGGTIILGGLSSLEVAPNTQLKLDFDQDGNVRVTLVRGCATARTKKNVIAQIDTSQGVAGKTDPKSRGFLSVCFPFGAASPTVVVGEAAGAAAAGGLFGLGNLTTIFLITGVGATGTLLALRGNNPSPSTP